MQPPDRGGKESLYIWSRIHDQDGPHACIWQKTLKNISSPEPRLETWYVASGTLVLQSLY